MNILFVGGLFPEQIRQSIYQNAKHNVDSAADAFQQNMLYGLKVVDGVAVRIVSSIFVGSYPRLHKQALIPSFDFVWNACFPGRHIGFLNIYAIKHVVRAVRVAREVLRRARKADAIVVYSAHTPFIFAAWLAKKAKPSMVACLVVADLPEYMNPSLTRPIAGGFLKRCDIWVQNLMLRSIDVYGLLTDQMAARLSLSKDRYVVIEGMAYTDASQVSASAAKHDGEKIVSYTGSLALAYGISRLLSGFMKTTDSSFRLWICGGGDGASLVSECASLDRRIRYWGLVDRATSMEIQARSTVLINPRSPEGEYTKYSFPSKILEYMLSGRPAIACPLPGMPSDYLPYYFPLYDASTDGIAEVLNRVLSLSESDLDNVGAKAREYVLAQKNPRVQMSRLLALIAERRRAAGLVVP